MKNLICLILWAALCLNGCGAQEPSQPDYTFQYQSTVIAMKAEAAPVMEALGEPMRYTEEPSCAFSGMDKTYYYGSFYLTTCFDGEQDLLYRLWFADDTVATQEGISIGSTREAVETAYGQACASGESTYVVTGTDTKLTIVLTEDTVSAIQYEAVFA